MARADLRHLLLASVVFSLCGPSVFAQFEWSANAESGLRTAEDEIKINSRSLYFGTEGNFSYSFSDDEKEAQVKCRVRPEFIPADKSLQSLRYRISSVYGQAFDDFSGRVLVSYQRNLLFFESMDVFHDIFILRGEGDAYSEGEKAGSCFAGYVNQKIEAGNERVMDVLFADGLLRYAVAGNSSLLYGVYAEKFSISTGKTALQPAGENTNKGYRAGPHVTFDFSKEFILNLDYRFLFHASGITSAPSYEHALRCLAGTNLGMRMSVFFLFDYDVRKFRYVENKEDNTLYYYPFDSENRLNLKLVYDIDENSELFLRCGYSKENLLIADRSFDSWNCFVGFRIESM